MFVSVFKGNYGKLARHVYPRFFATSNNTPSSNKIYELRRYTIKPELFGQYKKITNELFYLRTAESKLFGFWFVEIGSTLFQAVHIWEYDSLAHRTRVRALLDNKKDWKELYLSKALPCFDVLENSLMTVPQWCPEVKISPKKDGVFEMVTHLLPSKKSIHKEKELKHLTETHPKLSFADLIGFWTMEMGDHDKAVSLWRYDSIDQRQSWLLNQLTEGEQSDIETKSSFLMLPAPWSPMQ